MSTVDRILLLATGLLAAYQVVIGIDGVSAPAIVFYALAFGVLLIAGLLLIILGFSALESPLVVVAATAIPLSLSQGLVLEYVPSFGTAYLGFAVAGLLAVLVTRYMAPGIAGTVILAVVHGIAGLLIFGLPLFLSLSGRTSTGFALVSLGGALIGVGGLLLTFLKTGRPILPRQSIMAVLPGLLLAMMAAFVGGFALR